MGVDDVLKRAPLFSALDDESVAALQHATTETQIKRGEVIFREGELGNELYIIVRGKVKICRTTNDGRVSLLVVAGPGDAIGETALFDPGPRITTAIGITQTKLLMLDHDHLWAWIDANPGVAKALLQTLARRLRIGAEMMANLVFLDVPGRVAKALLDLANRFGVADPDGGIVVAHDLTQEELAQFVGASRETVNKVLSEFAGRGWIRVQGRAVVLLDVKKLRRRVHAVDPAKDPDSLPSADIVPVIRSM